ncbi:UNVERIFIED_CONTAM: Retrovirus-related Pol polyprotein from transposon RE1 [Sesamum indicum]
MLRTWILNAISKDIVNAYLYASSARALWLELEAQYGECDGPLLYKIQREIGFMTQGNLSVTTYYTNLKQLWDELVCLMPPAMCTCGKCTCGCNKTKVDQIEANQLMQFLMGLNESYDNIRNQILVLDPLPHVNKAYSMVLRVEMQRQVNLGFTDAGDSAMMSRNFGSKENLGQRNYVKRKESMDRRNLFCNHCKSGHNRDSCFKIHGIPDWYKDLNNQRKKSAAGGRVYVVGDLDQQHTVETATTETGVGNIQIADLVEALKLIQNKAPSDPVRVHFAHADEMAGMVKKSVSTYLSSKYWIVNTGATNHMCGNESLFYSLHSLNQPITVTFPDGSNSLATKAGDINLTSTLTLTHVFLIPSFKYNLLSVSQLCKTHSVSFIFLTFSCLLQDLKTKRILASGTQLGKLYILDDKSFHPHSVPQKCSTDSTCFSAIQTLYTLWHKRLGHSSPLVLKHISVLNIPQFKDDVICSVRPLAKQTRSAFPLNNSVSSHVFDLIHVDIWGPYRQPSLSGSHYILTIVDDYSKTTWTFLIQHKSQTLQLLSSFLAKAHTQFDSKVKAIRTDNGSEFMSLACQTLFQSHGIIHQKSCAYTPKQNVTVERKHRHLLQVARALMFESSLPRSFWVESILTATHIINRLPSPSLHWKSPSEILHNRPSSYANLKTFGCLCFVSNVTPYKNKFDQRAFRCIFIGYIPGQKGYKLYDLDNHVVLVSRDVVFHEHIFPYHSLTTSVSQSVPVPNPIPDSPISPNTDSSLPPTNSTDINISNAPTPAHLPSPSVSALRRSQRHTRHPTWLSDFHCHFTSSSPTNPSFALSTSHVELLAALSTVHELRTYLQVQGKVKWEQAMQDELNALEQNETWDVVDLPPGQHAIGSKWVFKVKLRPDGTVDQYKARLVAKGYNQVEGVDYFDQFSPVAKAVTVCLLFAVASSHSWPIHQIDINNAFLHGFLDEVIYMKAPDGYPISVGKVCRLKRSLYGYRRLGSGTSSLLLLCLDMIFHSLLTISVCLLNILQQVPLYFLSVDDVLLTGPCEEAIHDAKVFLDKAFTIKDLGAAKYFLGLEIARSTAGISITQHKYIRDIISDVGLSSSKMASTPLSLGIKLSALTSSPLLNPESYRRLVGRLLYLGFTRPDVSFAAQQVSQFVNNPGQEHMDAALHWILHFFR